MDVFELKREQQKLASKIELKDAIVRPRTIGGTDCVPVGDKGDKLLASVVVCEYPSFKLLEKQTYVLDNPLPFRQGFQSYREMPAIIEAYNLLEEEPDILLVKGTGIAHPRKIGIASHLGLSLNKPTIGVSQKLIFGNVEQGKIKFGLDIVGFEVKTREHANPVYVSPGHLVSLGSTINLIRSSIQYPHKMPEPVHIAHKVARKKAKKMREENESS